MATAVRSLTLGCAQFGKGYGFYVNTPELSLDEIGEILEVAFGEGIDTLDLAQGYEGVTTNLSRIRRVNRFKLGTKVKYSDSSDDKLIRALASDLKVLNARHFESILIHDWSDLTSSQKASGLDFLTELKNQGIAKLIGISVYESNELTEINEPIEIVQAPLSYFNTEFLFDENALSLARNGVSFHARSIFHQGTLLNTKTLPPRFHAEAKNYEEYCKEHGLTFVQAALAVYDSQDLFRKLVVGVSNAIQLHEITQSPVKVIDSILDQVPAGLPKDLIDPRRWTNK